MRPRSTLAVLLLCGSSGALSCGDLEPDPVIKDGVDLGPIQSFEAERIPWKSGIGSVSDPAASDTHAQEFYSTVATTTPLELLTEIGGLVVRARGESCKGAPVLVVAVDGIERLRTEVKATRWTDYPAQAHLLPGMHTIGLEFTNDLFEPPTCDRNLFVDKVTFVNARAIPTGDLPAVSMVLSGVQVVDDPAAQGQKAVGFMSETSILGQTKLLDATDGLTVRARGELCRGAPLLKVSVDGAEQPEISVESTSWREYPIAVPLGAGTHNIGLAFVNDHFEPGHCDRNLFVDVVRFGLAPRPPDAGSAPAPPAEKLR